MKKIIICQPLLKDDEKMQEARNGALTFLANNKYDPHYVIPDNVIQNNPEKYGIKNFSIYYLNDFFETMSKCDGVYFTKGWTTDRVCRIIRLAAILYKMDVLEEDIEKDKDNEIVTFS